MASLPFVPYDYPQCDFIFVLQDDEQLRERFLKLGATRVENPNYVLYLWDPRPSDVFDGD